MPPVSQPPASPRPEHDETRTSRWFAALRLIDVLAWHGPERWRRAHGLSGLSLAFFAATVAAIGTASARGEGLPVATATMELVALPGEGASPRVLLLSVPLRAAPPSGFPLVLLVPDTGGPGPRTDAYALRLLENGFAVAEPYVDTDVPRGLLPHAAEALASDTRLDPARLAAVALGAGARAALQEWAAGAPFVALALLYPGCDAALLETVRHAAPAARETPVLLLHGDVDAANPPMACAALSDALAGTARPTHRVLTGATYAWDATHLVPPGASLRAMHPAAPDGPRVLARPDAGMTLIAADRVIAFLTAARRLTGR
jgi:dienelactone hydrolase